MLTPGGDTCRRYWERWLREVKEKTFAIGRDLTAHRWTPLMLLDGHRTEISMSGLVCGKAALFVLLGPCAEVLFGAPYY